MDIVASPTSASPEESFRNPAANTSDQPRGGLQSHVNPSALGDKPKSFASRRPPIVKHLSSPGYSTPLRQHQRTPSSAKQVKESLNARSEYVTSRDDGVAEHHINQYIIKQEIGRGSFGAVHLATDQYGKEYAVKEFSKARLRKRAQSHILRQPLSQRRRGALQGFNSPLHRGNKDGDVQSNSMDLIKEEIAIMKKLNHPNLVSLYEVLDDPSEDSLYMVLEMCKKGVVMKVGLEERADPYPDHVCRYWFRDLILGIEYLHAQGVVHRDIKPDNCLVTEDDVLKVVDFGVSEMFSKDSEMRTAKSAGSPAFLPPELCVARHGDVSGRAADIWSMGVTLYCMKYGRIPFEKTGIFELYEAIKEDELDLTSESDEDFQDLMTRLLEKDPQKRIKMPELREHPWVTDRGTDSLLSEVENTRELVDPPTKAEMDAAITSNMRNLMTVVKAVNKFKALIGKDKGHVMTSILGDQEGSHFSYPPAAMAKESPAPAPKSHSFNEFGQEHSDKAPEIEKLSRDVNRLKVRPAPARSMDDITLPEESGRAVSSSAHETAASEEPLSRLQTIAEIEHFDPDNLPPFRSLKSHAYTTDEVGRKGHAHDPLEDQLYLYIGPSTFAGHSMASDNDDASFMEGDMPIVSESPGAADVDIYETAYRDEIERIMARAKEEQKEPNVYLTRRVDARLMAISGLAGKWAAMGEEAKNQIKDYTQFSARRARVTEVSRALRQAARQEYEKRRHEHREAVAAEKTEKAKAKENDGSKRNTPAASPATPGSADEAPVPATDKPQPPERVSSSLWKGKAVDAGRQAKTSLMGIMDRVKTKNRTRSQDEATS